MKSKRLLLTLLMALFVPWAANAQTLSEYTVTTGTETYTSIADADLLLPNVNGDGGIQAVTLPFNFPFGENTYTAGTTLTVRADGYIYFGSASPGHSCKSAWTNTTSEYYLIAPFLNYDGKITASGATSGAYCTTDDPNNPTVLIIEFKSLMCYYPTSGGGNGDYNFQVRLYSNGNISTVYGESTLTTYSNASQNFFLNAKADKICLTGSYAAPVAGKPSSLPNFTTAPAAGQVITYVRPVISCPKPANLVAEIVPGDGTKTTFSWIENGEATSWQLCINGDEENLIDMNENPFTYNGFTPEQTYTAKVRAYCSDTDQSQWTDPVTFTPTDAYVITVNEGTNTNYNIPLYYYTSYYTPRSQFIVPSTDLATIQWASINKLTFYYNSATSDYGTADFSVYVTEVNYTTMSAFADWTSLTNVYTGTLSVSDNKMVIEFSRPYTYSGGNLLIGFYTNSTGSTGTSSSWVGTNGTSGCSRYYTYSEGSSNFLPKMTIEYEPGEAPSCLPPTGLDVVADGLDVTVTWESDATQWQVAHAMSATANPDDNIVDLVSTKSFTMNELNLDDHYFWVRSYCSSDDQSIWVGPASVHIGYCNPAPMRVDNSGITNVTFGSGNYIVNNNTHSTTAPTYSNYSSQIGAVQAGVESTIAITYATGYSYNTYVWVDLNNDLSFDADEVICYGESTDSNPTTLTLNFTIPATQTLGDFRMRIGGADSGLGSDPAYADPCYTGDYGIFEDYTLRVLEAPSCVTPSGFDVTDYEATWNVGDGTKWNLQYKKTSETDWTAVTGLTAATYSFNLTELDYGTDYEVQVQTDCGTNGTSDWTNSKTFTTPLCDQADMCQIHLALTDSYGDGWNGNTLQVVDVSTNLVLGTFAGIDHNLSSTSCTDDFYLSVCDGRQIQFVYVLGSGTTYPGENSFVIYDVNGEVICEHGSNPTDFEFTYTANCAIITCKRPSDLTCTAKTGHTATFDWTDGEEGQTAWQISYSTDADFNPDKGTIADITHTDNTISGLAANTQYYAYIRANCGTSQEPDYSNWSVDKAAFKTNIGNPAPTAFHTTDIQQYQAGFDWTNGGGDYEESWMIYLWNESIDINNIADEDLDPSGFRSAGSHPTAIINLTPGTTYYAWVRSNCGSDGMSAWTALEGNSFMTVPTCPAPENLAVTPDSETTEGATITWDGTNDSFVVELGTYDFTATPSYVTILEEDMEGGSMPTGWTHIGNGIIEYYSYNSHSTSHCIKFSGATVDNVLVLPALSTKTNLLTISYWSKAEGSSSGEFDMGYLTDPTDASTFHAIHTNKYSEDGTSYTEVSNISMADAPANARVAFRHRSGATNWYWFLDDITIMGAEYPVIWTVDGTAPNVEGHGTYTFEGLDELTPYKARVKGICGSNDASPYSNVVDFTTLEACPTPKDFVLGAVTSRTAAFSWNGGIATGWKVWVKENGETEYPTNYYEVSTPSKTVENLSSNTSYDVKIVPTCDENKVFEKLNAFTTGYGIPFVETFTTSSIPANWALYNGSVTAAFNGTNPSSTTSGWVFGNTNVFGQYHARINNYSNNNYKWLTTPNIDLTTATDVNKLNLVFDLAVTGFGSTDAYEPGDNDQFRVLVSTNGGATWTEDNSWVWMNEGGDYVYSAIPNTGQTVMLPLANYANGSVMVAFYVECVGSDFDIHIDNVKVGEIATYQRTIAGHNNNEGGYALVATPVGTIYSFDMANTNMIADPAVDYDLYYFDQSQDLEWINYKDTENGGNFNLTTGKGYLYANKNTVNLTFTGIAYSGTGVVDLSYDANAEFAGWNLIGNPYATAATLNKPFYKMNETGDAFTAQIEDLTTTIAAMEGVFVQVTESGQSATFTAQTSKGEQQAIAHTNIVLSGNKGKVLDNAIIRFDNGETLGKFSFRENNAKIYIPMEGKDYAVVNAGKTGEIPVSFKAEKNGSYTLSFTSQEVTFSYLHLIDNLTGNDVNLLDNPSYTFDARTTDYANRFRLVFATGSSAENDNFGFVNASGNLCIFGIEGEATLQVVDVLGHVISSNQFSGSYESKLNVAPGVYMLRLINGNDVKVQKMVIK